MVGESIMDGKAVLDKVRDLGGVDLLRELITEVLQVVLEAERDERVGVGRYGRGEGREDVRSGYKPRTLKTSIGEVNLRRPQTRMGMRSAVLEDYDRVDQSVLSMAAEMYASGVSTRKVKALLERTVGTEVSPEVVSRANRRLDESIRDLRSRPLGETPVLLADARFDKVRQNGHVRSAALLVVAGVEADGRRRVLDFRAVSGETGASWKEVLESLRARGLHGVLWMVSDDHQGLRDALGQVFVGATWQRCQTHLMRNVLERVPKAARAQMAGKVRDIFHAPDEKTASARLRDLATSAERIRSGLGDYLEEVLPEGFSVLSLPESLRPRLRTSNLMERLMQEVKRRTRVARIFPSFESYERCAGTVLVHIDESWQEAGHRYLDIGALKEALADHPSIEAKEVA